ncbi:S-adenosyl-L-methionine-dependent methyltransferase [Zopfochytrium polystomum]|nr:S-adenosyl-L-methionine-dependent methyltransferase [Zopfochytrium polystomum]
MRQALTLPEMGYYMKGDVFGKSGDFVTSPEISQLFGEMIGVWLVSHWSSIGQPSKVRLVELGPGRGTLMLDILSTVQQLPGLRDAVESIHLIDASPFLRRKQAQTFGFDLADDAPPPTRLEGRKAPFVWHDHLDELPEGDSPVFVVCHEFFDALPVFQFERANDGWREILVDIDDSKESEYHFRFVKSTQATTACASMLGGARYEALGVGTRVEVCPEAYSLARAISGRVQRLGGAALFIDYGKNAILGDTFRGIRNHQFTSPLSMPGDSDLTADVDFSYLAQAAKKAEATPHGPITQAAFLEKMGIRPRLRILQRSAEDKAQVTALAQACDRLVSVAGGMGSVYKFLAVTPGGTTAPYPFGEA